MGRQTATVALIASLLLETVPCLGRCGSGRIEIMGGDGAKDVVKGGLGGNALGALIRAISGPSRDQKELAEERQQARIAAEIAHRRELEAIRNGEYVESKEWKEDVVVIEGYATSEEEVREAERRVDELEKRLKQLRAEVESAGNRVKVLEEAEVRDIKAEKGIPELEGELEALKKTLEEEKEPAE